MITMPFYSATDYPHQPSAHSGWECGETSRGQSPISEYSPHW